MTNFTSPVVKLYKRHSNGKTGWWSAYAEGNADSAQVVIQHAKSVNGGKVVESRYTAERKNVGRANETTAIEQAQLEIDSRRRKQLDKGYVESLKLAQESTGSTNTLGRKMPMLAKPIDKVKQDSIDWENAYAQPKLDGHRAMFDSELYSRQGKLIPLDHITQAIKDAGLDHLPLDGELYVHGETLQNIGSLIKRKQEGTERIAYHIYDVVSSESWSVRTARAWGHASETYKFNESVFLVPSVKVTSMGELLEIDMVYREQGYEGTMLRHGLAGYEDGKRSSSLLKIKTFDDAEFEIIGVREGKPTIRPDRIYRVPVYRMKTALGAEFEATAPGNMEEKDALWENREHAIGKMMTVKFHYYSKDLVPQLPVCLRFREDI